MDESRSLGIALVEQRDLVGRRYLESLNPSPQLISFYRRLLHTAALDPVEENIHWRGKIVQLNRSAKSTGGEPQCIPLRSSPGTPVDDHGGLARTPKANRPEPALRARPRSPRESRSRR